MHLARYELLLGTIAFFSAYPRACVAVETTDEDMKQVHYFVNAPKGGKCVVELNPKSEEVPVTTQGTKVVLGPVN